MGDNDQKIDKDYPEGFEPTQGADEIRPLSSDVSATLKAWDVKLTIDTRNEEDAGRVAVALLNAGHGGLEPDEDGRFEFIVQVNAVNEGAAKRAVVGSQVFLPVLNGHGFDAEVTLRGETYGDHRHDLNPALESGVGITGEVDAAQPIGAPAAAQDEDGDGTTEGVVTTSTPGERISEAARSGQDEARREEAEARVKDGEDLTVTDEDKDAIAADKAAGEAKAEAVEDGKSEDKADKAAAKAKTDAKKGGKGK